MGVKEMQVGEMLFTVWLSSIFTDHLVIGQPTGQQVAQTVVLGSDGHELMAASLLLSSTFPTVHYFSFNRINDDQLVDSLTHCRWSRSELSSATIVWGSLFLQCSAPSVRTSAKRAAGETSFSCETFCIFTIKPHTAPSWPKQWYLLPTPMIFSNPSCKHWACYECWENWAWEMKVKGFWKLKWGSRGKRGERDDGC